MQFLIAMCLLVCGFFASILQANPPSSFEIIPEDEAATTEKLVAGTQASMNAALHKLEEKIESLKKEGQPIAASLRAVRDAHPKSHGCVRGKFKILNDQELSSLGYPRNNFKAVRHRLAQGLFAKESSYQAWVRFSNGNAKSQPDYIPDGRGMAIKIIGVNGQRIELDQVNENHTQDFLMINFPQFFVKNVRDYIDFFADTPKFLASHQEEAKIARGIASQITTSPLETQYFSMTPISYGNDAVKYSAIPCVYAQSTTNIGNLPLAPLIEILKGLKNPSELSQHIATLSPRYDGYLREAMQEQLKDTKGCFLFLVQFHENQSTEPIEDPTVEWKTKFYPVARLTLPPQEFSSPKQDEFCDNLAFTPWHSLQAHRPLGGVQRARRVIYGTISETRRAFNLKQGLTSPDLMVEPTGNESF